MSNTDTDSFIEEVNEELKRDKLFATMRKYGWIAVVGVLGIVGGAAWNEWSKAQATARAEAFGDQIVAALDDADPAAQTAALQALTADGPREGIRNLLLAASALQAEDPQAAIAALQRVEQDGTLPASYRQIATLKRIIVAGSTLSADDRRAALSPLAAPGQPFRPLALEQLMLIDMELGNREAALEQANALVDDAESTPALRQRMEQMIIVLGGRN